MLPCGVRSTFGWLPDLTRQTMETAHAGVMIPAAEVDLAADLALLSDAAKLELFALGVLRRVK